MRSSRYIAQAGVIAAVYGGLTLIVIQNPLGFGPVQFRLSEAATVLALFTPAAGPGLVLGTVIANMSMVAHLGGIAFLDVVFGGLGTLLGAAWTWRFRRRRALALAGPVVANALIVPAYLPIMFKVAGWDWIPILGVDLSDHWLMVWGVGVLTVGFGQALVVYGLGWPLAGLLDRHLPQLLGSAVVADDA
jgi:uncharacterized membrane protein